MSFKNNLNQSSLLSFLLYKKKTKIHKIFPVLFGGKANKIFVKENVTYHKIPTPRKQSQNKQIIKKIKNPEKNKMKTKKRTPTATLRKETAMATLKKLTSTATHKDKRRRRKNKKKNKNRDHVKADVSKR